jgi:hypothetical protein
VKKCIISQYLAGSLSLSIEALRNIEEFSSSPEDMQTKMDYIDECGNRGQCFIRL